MYIRLLKFVMISILLMIGVLSTSQQETSLAHHPAPEPQTNTEQVSCLDPSVVPQLAVTGTESLGNGKTRFHLAITNHSLFPDEMFAPAPHLPPCGLNSNSSRTWVDIYSEQGYRYGFCGLGQASNLTNLWFVTSIDNPVNTAQVLIEDRECNTVYASNIIDISTQALNNSITYDGRLNNDAAAPIVLYQSSGDDYYIDAYAIVPDLSKGVLQLRLIQNQIEAIGIPSTGEHARLLISDINPTTGFPINIYRLSSGEFQVNTYYPNGKSYVFRWHPDNPSGGTHVEW